MSYFVESGLCECGCGEKTRIARRTYKRYGHVKGQPLRYINGHNKVAGEASGTWRGGKEDQGKYVRVLAPGHPAANKRGRVYEHRLVAEKGLGRYLTEREVVHHINGDTRDNRSENLVVFSSQADHVSAHAWGRD